MHSEQLSHKHSNSPCIVMTGGGTAGHVMPHMALLPGLRAAGWRCVYIGSAGIERDIASKHNIDFFEISAGKLRRYWSLANFVDPFKIIWGFVQAIFFLLKLRPRLVFSKGGFVSVPVCYAAWLLRIPVITHESDLTPGLATKLIIPIARQVLCTFPETIPLIANTRALYMGAIVRQQLLSGSRLRGFSTCGFAADDPRPVLMFMGGSLGAQRINNCLAEAFVSWQGRYRIIHLTGKGKAIGIQSPDYKSFEFVGEELADLFACTDFVVSRAGANALFEFLALRKPMLLIPLMLGSRGDQLDNANSFAKRNWARVLQETELSPETLGDGIAQLIASGPQLTAAQKSYDSTAVISKILALFATYK